MVQAHFINMGGLVAEDTEGNRLIVRGGAVVHMHAAELADFAKHLPLDEDIMDRSKSDSLTTILACLQSIWLVIQCIARKAHNLGMDNLRPLHRVTKYNMLQISLNLN